jgi:hypothetical protein
MAALAVVLSSMLVPVPVHADDESERDPELTALERALEFTASMGFVQGFGAVSARGPSLSTDAAGGGAGQFGVGYRLTPRLALGAYGSGALFDSGDLLDQTAKMYSGTAGMQADFHLLPAEYRYDPWFALGSGFRGYWMDEDEGRAALLGWDFARLRLGVDVRMDREVAVSPVFGVDFATFFRESTPSSSGFAKLDAQKVNTFLFVGVQGRYDIAMRTPQASRELTAR